MFLAFGRQVPEAFAHLRIVDDIVDLGDLAGEADEEAQLHHQADHALIVLHHVRAGLVPLRLPPLRRFLVSR